MNKLRDDSVVLDVQENNHTDGLDIRNEDRQAWVARLKKAFMRTNTLSRSWTAITTNRNDNNNCNSAVPSINRIPMCIREVDPTAYEPQVISLGPYNHNNQRLKAMDKLKRCYFLSFLRHNPNNDLDNYLALVEKHETRARGAYSELEPSIDSKHFVEMMLIDCCFVLQFMLMNGLNHEYWEDVGLKPGYWEDVDEYEEEEEQEEEEQQQQEEEEEEEKKKEIDPNENFTWAMPLVMRDMLLLENQLPFFLLEKLLKLHIPRNTPSLRRIVCCTFLDLMPGKIYTTRVGIKVPIRHILHLVHSCAIPTPKTRDEWQGVARRVQRRVQYSNSGGDFPGLTQLCIPSAMKLKDMGVVFKRKRDPETFLDVTFNRTVMEIPSLKIFNHVGSFLHNLIAFEQCCTTNNDALSYFSSYACLMNFMVNTAADVQMLKREGIIFGTLDSDDDVVNLFKKLSKNTMIDTSCCLTRIFYDIQIHCSKRTSRWKATLNQNWEIISVAAAIFLFVLSIIQTVLAFFSYLRPISPN